MFTPLGSVGRFTNCPAIFFAQNPRPGTGIDSLLQTLPSIPSEMPYFWQGWPWAVPRLPRRARRGSKRPRFSGLLINPKIERLGIRYSLIETTRRRHCSGVFSIPPDVTVLEEIVSLFADGICLGLNRPNRAVGHCRDLFT
jgi:hypothetical protein